MVENYFDEANLQKLFLHEIVADLFWLELVQGASYFLDYEGYKNPNILRDHAWWKGNSLNGIENKTIRR